MRRRVNEWTTFDLQGRSFLTFSEKINNIHATARQSRLSVVMVMARRTRGSSMTGGSKDPGQARPTSGQVARMEAAHETTAWGDGWLLVVGVWGWCRWWWWWLWWWGGRRKGE